MHSIEIPELDETSYTRFNKTLSSTIPQWNTRDISTEWIFIYRHQNGVVFIKKSNASTCNTLLKHTVMKKLFYTLQMVGVGLIQDQCSIGRRQLEYVRSVKLCSELQQNIKWVEDLIRNYHNDEERPVLWYAYDF